MPKLLDIKNQADKPLSFHVLIEFGDGETPPEDAAVKSINSLLGDILEGFQLEK